MTLQECYERLHGDYPRARQQLMNDKLVDRFILKFPSDSSIELLRSSLEKGDIAESFRGAHSLKGVAANLAFTELQENVSALTEQLRTLDAPADPELLRKVESSYRLVIETLAAYEAEK